MKGCQDNVQQSWSTPLLSIWEKWDFNTQDQWIWTSSYTGRWAITI